MTGLEKNRMKRDRQTDRQTDIRTSRLYDRIGPVGRFDENLLATLQDVIADVNSCHKKDTLFVVQTDRNPYFRPENN